jgi:ubiquinone biosynthesis protein COQ9
MFDEFSKRSKAVRAALELAKHRDWGDIGLSDIAEAAGLQLADLRTEFACKSDILRAFQKEVDANVLAKAKRADGDQSVRERLFDLIMTRFDVMAPYKPALKRIACHLRCRPGEASLLACSTMASQYWMLAGAGAKLSGPRAAMGVTGLAAVYGKVFEVWLEDSSPSLDRTMAALDRALSKSERMMAKMDKACGLLCGLLPRGWRDRGETDAPSQPPASTPDTGGPAPAGAS